MTYLYKAGDKVRMLEDYIAKDCYTFYKGEVYTVKLVFNDRNVQVYTPYQEDYWSVDVSKFELVEPSDESSDVSNIDNEQQEDKETLRDKFAMAALTGKLASSNLNHNYSYETLAKYCYKMADAMMEARNE